LCTRSRLSQTVSDRKSRRLGARQRLAVRCCGSFRKLRAVILPYLGQDDSRLKYRPADLVTREEAYA
jgi:hypothetical protein